MKKGLDRTFLNYGIREDDMMLIESACQSEGIDADWLKDCILKPFQDERNNQNEANLDEKKVARILKKALKEIKK
ncbi:MAG TPA: hypothetical protein PLP97_05540 [Prevotella sp.]|jgi:hypothetical protein|nr:hypothetical protein [uncultured Prevotella sp.]HRM56698.1 hypothetical protein [Prevotella sp.]